jgi:hypothetical protein
MLRFEPSMLRFEASILRFEASMLRFEASMLRFEPSMLHFEPSMLRFEASMLHFEPSMLCFGDPCRSSGGSALGMYVAGAVRTTVINAAYETHPVKCGPVLAIQKSAAQRKGATE